MSMLCGLSLAVVAGVGILDGGLSLRCWVPTATAGLFLSGLPWLLVFDGRLWAATGILLELTTALIVILFFSQPKTTYLVGVMLSPLSQLAPPLVVANSQSHQFSHERQLRLLPRRVLGPHSVHIIILSAVRYAHWFKRF